MNKKSFYVLGLACGIVIGSISYAANQYVQALLNQEIKVSLNGQIQEFKDASTGEIMYPLTYKDRTYLPLRNVAETLGLDVDYDESSKTAILNTKNDTNNITVEKYNDRDWLKKNLNIKEDYFGKKIENYDKFEYNFKKINDKLAFVVATEYDDDYFATVGFVIGVNSKNEVSIDTTDVMHPGHGGFDVLSDGKTIVNTWNHMDTALRSFGTVDFDENGKVKITWKDNLTWSGDYEECQINGKDVSKEKLMENLMKYGWKE